MTHFAPPLEEGYTLAEPDAPVLSGVTKVSDQPSDKFGIFNTNAIGTDRPIQLLPVDPTRKDAVIICMGNAIYVGDMGSISNALGTPYSTSFIPPGCFVLTPSDVLNGPVIPLHYDSKQSLWACCAVAGVAQVQLITSRFESGTPIT